MTKLALVDESFAVRQSCGPTSDPMTRLGCAIIAMDAVMRRQRRELTHFREVMVQMDQSMNALRQSLSDYHRALAGIDTKRLRLKALRLGQIVAPDFD